VTPQALVAAAGLAQESPLAGDGGDTNSEDASKRDDKAAAASLTTCPIEYDIFSDWEAAQRSKNETKTTQCPSEYDIFSDSEAAQRSEDGTKTIRCPSEYDIFSDSEAARRSEDGTKTIRCPSEYGDNIDWETAERLFSDSEIAVWDAEPALNATRARILGGAQATVVADRHVFLPREGGSFPCGRPCVVQYNVCQAFPENGMPPRVRFEHPLDFPEMREILGKKMGWQGELPPTRERLLNPTPDDPWFAVSEEMLQVPISKLSVIKEEVTEQGGYLAVLARDIFTGWW